MTSPTKLHPRETLEEVSRLYDQLQSEESALANMKWVLGQPNLVIRLGTGPYHLPGRAGLDSRDYSVIDIPSHFHESRKRLAEILTFVAEKNIESIRERITDLGFDPDQR